MECTAARESQRPRGAPVLRIAPAGPTLQDMFKGLHPTPPDRLTDARGRPYFLWDEDLDIDGFRARLGDGNDALRGYYLGKLMRQAKPDDVFGFVTVADIRRDWVHLERYLGRSKPFWVFLLGFWEQRGV